MAIGLGLPYLILGTFSSLLFKLLKSGQWMVWVKKVFGVVLVGAVLFFLFLAWLPKYVLYTLPPTLILGGIYLGFMESYGTIKVDLIDYESAESEALRKQFDVAGVPTIIFLDSQGNEVKKSRIVGFADLEEFLNIMPE